MIANEDLGFLAKIPAEPQNKTPHDSGLSRGTLVEQPSPEVCSTTTLQAGVRGGNGPFGLLGDIDENNGFMQSRRFSKARREL